MQPPDSSFCIGEGGRDPKSFASPICAKFPQFHLTFIHLIVFDGVKLFTLRTVRPRPDLGAVGDKDHHPLAQLVGALVGVREELRLHGSHRAEIIRIDRRIGQGRHLQSFSLGLVQLRPDGTVLKDSKGNPVPTYNQDYVEGFARSFTGWTYPVKPGEPMWPHNPANRKNLALPSASPLPVTSGKAGFALHPKLTEVEALWKSQNLAAIANIVFPNIGNFKVSDLGFLK